MMSLCTLFQVHARSMAVPRCSDWLSRRDLQSQQLLNFFLRKVLRKEQKAYMKLKWCDWRRNLLTQIIQTRNNIGFELFISAPTKAWAFFEAKTCILEAMRWIWARFSGEDAMILSPGDISSSSELARMALEGTFMARVSGDMMQVVEAPVLSGLALFAIFSSRDSISAGVKVARGYFGAGSGLWVSAKLAPRF